MAGDKTTPMMRQYHSIKARYQDMILFFRMGDFYEMFEQDAREASAILNLTLTARAGTPMCGIPYHAAANYLRRLLKAGKKVAVCEQVEDPAQAKGIVRREVTRVVTPGTLTDEGLLESPENNFLAGCCCDGKRASLACCDISTGEFFVSVSGQQGDTEAFLRDELSRSSPAELLVAAGQQSFLPRLRSLPLVTPLPDWVLDGDLATKALKEQLGVVSLEGFLLTAEDLSLQAAHLVIHYLKETQQSVLANVRTIRRLDAQEVVALPSATQINLELVENLSGGREHTLLSVLNDTRTPMGVRFLRSCLQRPLADAADINRRLDMVQALVEDEGFREALGRELGEIRDLERLISRVSLGRANARDLVGLRVSLERTLQVRRLLLEKPVFLAFRERLDDFTPLVDRIARAICDEPPAHTNEGGMIRDGFDADLDALRALSRDSHDWVARMQAEERTRTGIASLKVKYNKVMGYFIEVSKANLGNVPDNYERKQTLVNGERYVTPELKEYESRILSARERIIALEEKLFRQEVAAAAAFVDGIKRAAAVVARLDTFGAFARLALHNDYVRPLVNDGDRIIISEGRHPVVERTLEERFVPNSLTLDLEENRLLIVTGPNMAGKSTYLRQAALITLMAQIGCYVPAQAAEIGVVDRIFTRVGASDNLALGQSTFLVEMLETAAILNSATRRSLIIMDEIGRGTSTYDGLSIAWAVLEYLLHHPERGGRTLFATHYHELTVLGEAPGVQNLNVQVKEWNEEVIFLKKVVPGTADRSYGIHVARLAGLPREVIRRARELLRELEDKSEEMRRDDLEQAGGHTTPDPQLPLFRPYEQEVLATLRELDLERISPLDALNLLAEWQDKV